MVEYLESILIYKNIPSQDPMTYITVVAVPHDGAPSK